MIDSTRQTKERMMSTTTNQIQVEHLGEATTEYADAEAGTILIKRGTFSDHVIRKTDKTCGWHSILVENKVVSGGAAHHNPRSTYWVTFSGGTPSASRGWELTFATRPLFNPDPFKHVLAPRTMEERERAHYDHIKGLIKPHVGWTNDKTVGETSGFGESYLESFSHIAGDRFSNTYAVVVVRAYCD